MAELIKRPTLDKSETFALTGKARPVISGHCPLVVDKGRVVIGGWEDLDTRQGVRRRE